MQLTNTGNMKTRQHITRLILMALTVFFSITASAWDTWGPRSGNSYCSDPGGGEYLRYWIYRGDNFNVDLNQKPTQGEYFQTTHGTFSWDEPYFEFKVKVAGIWYSDYPMLATHLRVQLNGASVASFDHDTKHGYLSDGYPQQSANWYLSKYNYMPSNDMPQIARVAIVGQEGRRETKLHSCLTGNVYITIRVYPTMKAIQDGIQTFGVSGDFIFDGASDDATLSFKYIKTARLDLGRRSQKVEFRNVGPGKVEYSLPANKDADKRRIDYVLYHNGQSSRNMAEKQKIVTGTLNRKAMDEPCEILYRALIMQQQEVYPVYSSSTGDVDKAYVSYDDVEPDGIGDLYKETLPASSRPRQLEAVFKKWGTPRVELKWLPLEKDLKGGDCDTDGKWHIYRAETDAKGVIVENFKYLATVDYATTEYKDINAEKDKSYRYVVMFAPNTWSAEYWKPDDGYVSELSAFSNAVVTNVDLALSALTQQETADGENGVRIAWSSESVEDKGVEFLIKRKVGADGKWDDRYATVEAVGQDHSFLDEDARSAGTPYYYKVAVSAMGKTFETPEAKFYYGKHSRLKTLQATTGLYADKVRLEAAVDKITSDPSRYDVQRRLKGSENGFMSIGTGTVSGSQLVFEDNTARVGNVYEYKVVLQEKDAAGEYADINELTAVGFCRSTGIVSGRVTYGTGVAVEGVKVKVTADTNDELSSTGQYALHAETGSKGIRWAPAKEKYAGIFAADRKFSVQLWARPDYPADGVRPTLISVGGAFKICLALKNDGYHPQVVDAKGNTTDVDGLLLGVEEYTSLAASYSGDGRLTLTTIADNASSGAEEARSATVELPAWQLDADGYELCVAGDESPAESNAYTGCVDEIRIWRKAITQDEIARNYDRLIGGAETALAAYWPLDEGLDSDVFDYSVTGDVANQNNPQADLGMKSVALTPASLGIYGLTDSNGNYIVRGIPYSSAGTNYIIRPLYGTHQFSPGHLTAFMSSQSATSSATDFTDVSSFPVSGTVVYQGTNFPVEGAMLMVDGQYCMVEGREVKTDKEGRFQISVPIGEHSVGVSLGKHTFVNEGRYPAEGLHVFKEPMTGLTFEDATTVTFTGRVTGGDTEGKKPVGFAASRNTIGQARLTLKASDMYYLNCQWNGTRYEPADSARLVESTTEFISSKAYRGTGSDGARRIYIDTDPQTGEFSAKVPPLRYTIESVTVKNNPDVAFEDIPKTIDITNVGAEYKDSMLVAKAGGDSIMAYYPYQLKILQTYYDPHTKFIVSQIDADGSAQSGAFGMKSYEKGDVKIDKLWTYDEQAGQPEYMFGYPVFRQNDYYEFQIEAYDEYVNYDNPKPLTTRVPQSGVKVTVANAMSSEQTVITQSEYSDVEQGDIYHLKENQLLLDREGKGKVRWRAGFPNVTSPYTRSVNVMADFNGRTVSAPTITGIVLGALPKGNNFVTQGPDRIVTVLRDPPASSSQVTIQNDTICSSEQTVSSYSGHAETNETEIAFGVKSDRILGFSLIDSSETKGASYEEGEHESQNSSSTTHTVRTTISRAISTSDNSEYVGADGDVFVGYSTNVIIGDSRNLFIRPDAETGGYKIEAYDGTVMDQRFSTAFHYSQLEIETKQIPLWEKLRNSLLLRQPRVASAEEAKGVANTGRLPIYVTWLSPDDDDFGREGTYECIPPAHVDSVVTDSVYYMNQQIDLWKSYLRQNERDKVQAFSDRQQFFVENISLDGGASIEHSYTNEVEDAEAIESEYSWRVLVGGATGYAWNKVGIRSQLMGGRIWGGGRGDSKAKGYSQTYTWTLLDANAYTDLSVDVYKSPAGWGPIFRTRGGQTACPWEREERTRYYEPESRADSHIICYATQAIERPRLYCDERTVNDVAPGQPAVFKIRLANESEADLENSYVLKVVSASNPHGAAITVDGATLNKGVEYNFGVGEVIEKTLTVRQTDMSASRLENLAIILASTCQDDPASYFGAVADTLYLNVNYAPTSTDVALSMPNTTVNLATGTKMDLTIDGFDRAFRNFYALRLQYRYGGSSEWTTLREYVANAADSADISQGVIPTAGSIVYTLDMGDVAAWPDGQYTFRCLSVVRNGNQEVTKSSPETVVTKDTERPKPLGYPTPKDGFLRAGDEISVTFNEDILRGQLTGNNVVVSGFLNSKPLAHGVAARLKGQPLATHGEYNMAGNDFTAEMWLYRNGAGEILRHGYGGTALTAAVDAEGHLAVDFNGEKMLSEKTVPEGKWVFLALAVDNTEDHVMTAVEAYDDEQLTLFDRVGVPQYAGRSELIVGNGLDGMVHDISLWNYCRLPEESFSEMGRTKLPNDFGLAGYWKLDEGQGTEADDVMGRNDMYFAASRPSWYLDNENLAAQLSGSAHIDIPIASVSTTRRDSYAVEMWFQAKSDGNGDDQTLFQVGTDADSLLSVRMSAAGDKIRIIHSGEEDSFESYGIADGQWHHLAFCVRRGVAARLLIDGMGIATLLEKEVPALAGSVMRVGASLSQKRDSHGNILSESYSRFLTGAVDEVKIWNADLSGEYLANRSNIRADGEKGLVAYYPFEKLSQDEYHQWVASFSLAEASAGKLEAAAEGVTPQDDAPPMQRQPRRTVLNTSFTASERTIVATINNELEEYNGTTLDFEVSDVRDFNGNVAQPVKWSAFVDKNTLKWSKREVSLTVKAGEEAYFDVDIQNGGALTENYYLVGVPRWVDIDETLESGKLQPTESMRLTFRVPASVAVGQHDGIVYLVGNNTICEPLRISVSVEAQSPGWSVDAAMYDKSMNIVAQALVGGTPVTGAKSVLAAFASGKCVGVASPKYVQSADGYFFAMTVYGDKSEPLEFRLWDASTGLTYSNMKTSRPVSFADQSIVGSFREPLIVENASEREQQLAFQKGWNWASLYLKPADDDINTVLAAAAGKLSLVKTDEAFAMDEGNTLVGPLTSLEPKRMFAVNAKEAAEARVYGSLLAGRDLDISLMKGWNWLGSTSPQAMTLQEAFTGLNPDDGDVIKSQRSFAMYYNGRWEGNLEAIQPGAGYKYLNSGSDVKTFRFPQPSPNAMPQPQRLGDARGVSGFFTPVDKGKYPDNMTVVAEVRDGATAIDTLELAAFVGEECRAVATAVGGKFFISVPGDADGGEVRFKTLIGGRVVAFNASVAYRSDDIVGSPQAPFVLDLDDTSAIPEIGLPADGISVSPRCVSRELLVEAGSEMRHISVYNAHGMLVLEASPESSSAVLDFTHLPQGSYILKVRLKGGGTAVERVTKR